MHHLTDIGEMNERQCPFLLINVYISIVIYPSDLFIYRRMTSVPYKMGVWEIG